MKKNELNLSRAVPPMPESFVRRMDETLKEIESMKKRKKMTIALVAAMIAVLALTSVAVAQAIDSGILDRLFGGREPSQQAAELLQTDLNTVTQDGITLTVDELLFDGRSINYGWSLSSEREGAVFAGLSYEIVGIDQSLFNSENSRGTTASINIGDNALVMLGEQGSLSAPRSGSFWSQSNFKQLIENEFEIVLTARIYTTELTPVLTDELYPDAALSSEWERNGQIGVCADEENFIACLSEYPAFSAALNASPLRNTGEYDADGSIWNQININAHEESGLMKKIAELTLTIPVQPAANDSLTVFGPETFELDGCTLMIEEVAFSPVSVTMDMRIYPKEVRDGETFFSYRVIATAGGEYWYLNLGGDEYTDESGNFYYDINLDGPPVDEIPEEITFIRVDQRREGEAPADQYARLIREAPEGMRATMKLK